MTKEDYLQKLQSEKTNIKLFLSNGTMLTGRVTSFDDSSLVLDKCLVFFDKIISIVPA